MKKIYALKTITMQNINIITFLCSDAKSEVFTINSPRQANTLVMWLSQWRLVVTGIEILLSIN